jgi:hypothetical protein
MGILYPPWYCHDMTQILTPLTAPTPSTPTPWYCVSEVTVISPEGASIAWGIFRESDEEFFRTEDDATHYWLAKTRNCAILHVRYLNGHTSEFPTCICQ